MTPLEILVHVSGPSRAADDARYRKEALGFLEFHVVERHTITGPGSRTSDGAKPVHSLVVTEKDPFHGPPAVEEAKPSSQAENATDKSSTNDWPNRYRTPVLSRPKSSTLLWTATKQTPHLLVKRTPAQPRPRTAPTASTPSQAPPLRRSQSDSWHTPPSEVPDSQPTPRPLGLPDISSPPCLKRPFASSSPSPTRHASPPAKRPRLGVSSSPPSEGAPVEGRLSATAPFSLSPSASGPHPDLPSSPPSNKPALKTRHPAAAPSSSLRSADNPPASSPPTTDLPQTLEIHPPRPKTSKAAFKTHLTFSLKEVAKALPLAKHFKPITIVRTPETLERGHWLIPIDRWDEKVKREFWEFLTKFVGGGQAGWGTWCVRDFQAPIRDRNSDNENQTPQRGEVVKVYCWGEVVGEIWLLLRIGGGKNVKGIGARWVDACGTAVVVVG